MKRRRLAPMEDQIHMAVAALLRSSAHPDVPWTHFPAGEKRDPITGARLKRMGMKRGWADFILIASGRPCFLELKTEDGRQSPEQKAFQLQCERQGAAYAIARSATEAHIILQSWGALRATQGVRRAA